MQLQQLKYVLEVEQTGSMNKAAQNLFVSQPNLSSAIRKLEEELNVHIFKRTNRGTEVTDEGKLLVQYAKSILGQVEQLKKAYGVEEKKHVRFLEISQTGMIHLAPVISRIYNQFNESRVEIRIKENNLGEVIKHLYYMRSEVAVVTMNATELQLIEKVLDQRKIELNFLNKTRLGVIVSPKSCLYNRESVCFEVLSELTYIECIADKNLSSQHSSELVEVWSRFVGNTICVNNQETVVELLWHLDCYSFDLEMNAAYFKAKGLKFIPIEEAIEMHVAWVKRKRERLSEEATHLIETLMQTL